MRNILPRFCGVSSGGYFSEDSCYWKLCSFFRGRIWCTLFACHVEAVAVVLWSFLWVNRSDNKLLLETLLLFRWPHLVLFVTLPWTLHFLGALPYCSGYHEEDWL